MSTDEERLKALLRARVPQVADDGFTERVMAGVIADMAARTGPEVTASDAIGEGAVTGIGTDEANAGFAPRGPLIDLILAGLLGGVAVLMAGVGDSGAAHLLGGLRASLVDRLEPLLGSGPTTVAVPDPSVLAVLLVMLLMTVPMVLEEA
jgi:hypothetical protein